MKENFDESLKAVLAHEGGYVDHPSDPGGATNMGITRKTLARWRRVTPWWLLPKEEVKNLKLPEVTAIYRRNYWDAVKGDIMPSGLGYALFDFGVNSGAGRAVKTLQGVLHLKMDGVIGPKTLAAIAALSPEDVRYTINQLCLNRLSFLSRLSTFKVFGRGWTKRVEGVRILALKLADGKTMPKSIAPLPHGPKQNDPAPKAGWGIAAAAVALVTAIRYYLQSKGLFL